MPRTELSRVHPTLQVSEPEGDLMAHGPVGICRGNGV